MTQYMHFLVTIAVDHPSYMGDGETADVIEQALESLIDDGGLDYCHGSGPNPPYYDRPRLVGVSTEVT